MRILFANGRQTYPLFQGGDGISMHNLLSRLYQDQHQVLHIGKLDPPHIEHSQHQTLKMLTKLQVKYKESNDGISYGIYGYKCILVEDKSFIRNLSKHIVSFSPDIILTQLNNSQEVIQVAAGCRKKIILLIHDHDPLNYLTINNSHNISHIIFNSKSTSNHFKKLLKCSSSIIYPSIRLEDYLCNVINPKYITMINPIFSKGIAIVQQVAKHFPKEKFLLIKGWRKPELSNSCSNNIIIKNRQYDMRKIYEKSKLVLIPSQWEESFCRIIPEAGINKIPIIASRVGGIPEALGEGGILINKYNDVQSWCFEIKRLLDNEALGIRLGDLAYVQAKKFAFNKIYHQLLSVFNAVHHS